jgi:hypothetical protein
MRRQVAIDRDTRVLHVGARLLDDAHAACLAVRRDLLRLAGALGAAPRIGGLLVDQLAFAAGELGLVVQLVLGDGALLLDRERAALEHCLVGLLLQSLEGGRLQGALELGAGRDGGKPDGDDGDAHRGQPLAAEARRQAGAQRLDPGVEQALHLGLSEILRRQLLAHAGQQGIDLLDRFGSVPPALEVDAEVDAGAEHVRIGDAPGQRPLHGHGLEVLRASLEEQHRVAVVHGQLGDAGALRQEPEGEAAAGFGDAAVAEARDMNARVAAQVPHETIGLDVSHDRPPQLDRVESAPRNANTVVPP